MPDIKNMMDDPEPLNEHDPTVQEEMFEQYKEHDLMPEDMPGMSKRLRKKYAEWLKAHS